MLVRRGRSSDHGDPELQEVSGQAEADGDGGGRPGQDEPARPQTPSNTGAGAPAWMPPSSAARPSTFMAGSMRARLRHLVGRDAPDDRLVDGDGRLDTDRGLERRHHDALLESWCSRYALVNDASSRYRRCVRPAGPPRMPRRPRRHLGSWSIRASRRRGRGDLLGEVRQVELDRGLDVVSSCSACARAARLRFRCGRRDPPGWCARSGRDVPPPTPLRTARRGCPCGCRGTDPRSPARIRSGWSARRWSRCAPWSGVVVEDHREEIAYECAAQRLVAEC